METKEITKEVEDRMIEGNLPPSLIRDYIVKLTGHQSYMMGMLIDIRDKKRSIWNTMRPDHKSDKACERAWEATSEGGIELHLDSETRRVDKMVQALKYAQRLAEMEAKNIL